MPEAPAPRRNPTNVNTRGNGIKAVAPNSPSGDGGGQGRPDNPQTPVKESAKDTKRRRPRRHEKVPYTHACIL